jgi:hypothetical protein
MSYAVKYRLQYTNYFGEAIKIDIEKQDYSGAITSLEATGEGYTKNLQVSDDLNHWNTFRVTEVFIYFNKVTDIDLSELFDATAFQFKVLIYKGVSLYWKGYLTPEGMEEPYKMLPYEMKLRAVDSLGMLKKIPFKTDIGLNYKGLYTVWNLVTEILTKITDIDNENGTIWLINRYSYDTLTYYDNLLKSHHINADIFGKGSSTKSCYDVLKTLLSAYQLSITFKSRPELSAGQALPGWVIENMTYLYDDVWVEVYDLSIDNGQTIQYQYGENRSMALISKNAEDSNLLLWIDESAIQRRQAAWAGFDIKNDKKVKTDNPGIPNGDFSLGDSTNWIITENAIDTSYTNWQDANRDGQYDTYEAPFKGIYYYGVTNRGPGVDEFKKENTDIDANKYYYYNVHAKTTITNQSLYVQSGTTFKIKFKGIGYGSCSMRVSLISPITGNYTSFLKPSGYWSLNGEPSDDKYYLDFTGGNGPISPAYNTFDTEFELEMQRIPYEGYLRIDVYCWSEVTQESIIITVRPPVSEMQTIAKGSQRIEYVRVENVLTGSSSGDQSNSFYFSCSKDGNYKGSFELGLRDGINYPLVNQSQFDYTDWTYKKQSTYRGSEISLSNVFLNSSGGLYFNLTTAGAGYLARAVGGRVVGGNWSEGTYSNVCYTLLEAIAFAIWEQHNKPLWVVAGTLLSKSLQDDTIIIFDDGRKFLIQTATEKGYSCQWDVELLEIAKPLGARDFITGDFNNDFNDDFLT